MSIETDLKKDGIEVLEKISTLKINSIAKSLSVRISEAFPEYNLNQNDLFIKLSRLNMYRAKMQDGIAEATYLYKNSSIYFNIKISEEDLEEFAIHECIHYLQEIKDKKGNIQRMGLCEYSGSTPFGLGLNEAAVQLISSKITGIKKEYVKYFGIGFESTSPSYYPLQCCLVNQLAYLIGENILFDSTFNSNDNFKNAISEVISPKSFQIIQKSIDELLFFEEEIIKLNNKIREIDYRNKKADDLIKKVDELKSELALTFMRTQNSIITTYFDSTFDHITNFEEIETYRRKLYNFKNFIASTDGYTYFNTYYVSKMEALEERYYALENGEIFEKPQLALIVQKDSFFSKLFRAIRKLIYVKGHSAQEDFDN